MSLNTKLMDHFIKAMENIPTVKLGVLGGKDHRNDKNSNATIGAKHEFGADGMPKRSWLRVPITENLYKYLEASGAFNDAVLDKVIQTRSGRAWMEKVAVVSEAVIADSFASGGFGKWKPSNMLHKKNKQTLVETQQLRNSVSTEIE